MTDETTPIKIQHEYVTDATFVPRAYRAFLAMKLLQPMNLISYGFLAFATLVLGVTTLLGLTDAGIPLLVFIGFFALLWAFILIALRRGMARSTPVGSRYALGLGEDALRLEGPLVSSEIKYVAFRSIEVRGSFVFLQQRANKRYSVLPIELLPGADLDRLRSAITRANPYSA